MNCQLWALTNASGTTEKPENELGGESLPVVFLI